jgi:hypothetical protein
VTTGPPIDEGSDPATVADAISRLVPVPATLCVWIVLLVGHRLPAFACSSCSRWGAARGCHRRVVSTPTRPAAKVVQANSLDPIDQGDFGIGPGCTFEDGDPQTPAVSARPPVRMREFAEAFETGGGANIHSICHSDYSSVLEAIAGSIADQLRPACMLSCVADTDQITPGVQPQCTMTQESPDLTSGSVVEISVEPCTANGELPAGQDVCYVALSGDQLSEVCAQEGWNLEFRLVRRPGVPAPGGTYVSANCELTQNKAIDCPNLP